MKDLRQVLKQIRDRSQTMLHQNVGRWDLDKEHQRRALNVTEGNIEIINKALAKNEPELFSKMNAAQAYDLTILVCDAKRPNYAEIKAEIIKSVADGCLSTGYFDKDNALKPTQETIDKLKEEGYKVTVYPSGAWEIFWSMA